MALIPFDTPREEGRTGKGLKIFGHRNSLAEMWGGLKWRHKAFYRVTGFSMFVKEKNISNNQVFAGWQLF